ncbi:putative component of membrane protein insertase Oxa1/YidC/SpoIIIJ protein YidD [Aquimarina sp. EL_43]|uniref:membrane protein insertion efficiency factor YidD n=1 Tax=unclassified Aquimarina TaxID=2627091 RepID=UPI0018CB8450|nr:MULTISPECIES: membrane protein insertion efficiency factor YidD [unclassified Aquimarina]MBG6129408.1 putative component of membrane protein insertase Oxa1/YidC/SpoIIIJ protein YidD [Aquimarina sp. EL_35]MBG6150473.1 putative component of membrane protein insertase Oxa1/YidC/SpoIIIJ protein YidD [Aquimarina sp. EL_32]MBG6168219.1 putative component of membrane protein insertase Oxa1/YidC/SpoIIIJ protein YidD [Aquimarina sp. EL_43]
MKHILLFTIKMYWFLIPKSKRRRCVFRKSCSNYVYEQINNNGINSGIKAFRYRFRNCRSGFQLFKNPINNETQIILPNQEIIKQEEISKHFL